MQTCTSARPLHPSPRKRTRGTTERSARRHTLRAMCSAAAARPPVVGELRVAVCGCGAVKCGEWLPPCRRTKPQQSWRSRPPRTRGQDELSEGRQRCVHLVDPALQLRRVRVAERRPLQARGREGLFGYFATAEKLLCQALLPRASRSRQPPPACSLWSVEVGRGVATAAPTSSSRDCIVSSCSGGGGGGHHMRPLVGTRYLDDGISNQLPQLPQAAQACRRLACRASAASSARACSRASPSVELTCGGSARRAWAGWAAIKLAQRRKHAALPSMADAQRARRSRPWPPFPPRPTSSTSPSAANTASSLGRRSPLYRLLAPPSPVRV